jgi:hypothetical protein
LKLHLRKLKEETTKEHSHYEKAIKTPNNSQQDTPIKFKDIDEKQHHETWKSNLLLKPKN